MTGIQRHFKLRPSRIYFLLLSILSLTALAALWLLPLPASRLLALTLIVVCWSGYALFLESNLRMGRACVAFRLEEQEEVVLVLRNGRHLSGRILSDSLVTPYIAILNISLNDQRRVRSLLVLPDAMGADSYRRLRIALRWGGRTDQALV